MDNTMLKGWISGNNRRYCSVNGVARLHSRIVMEEHLGRPLGKDEVVHHINMDTLDDQISNLILMKQRDHRILHSTGKDRSNQCSEEQKIRQSKIMKTAWATGVFSKRVFTDDARRRISEAKKKEWADGKRDKQFTEITRSKMSTSMKKAWRDGKFPRDFAEKHSKSTKNNWANGVYVNNSSAEFNKKRSDTMKLRWAEGAFKNRGK